MLNTETRGMVVSSDDGKPEDGATGTLDSSATKTKKKKRKKRKNRKRKES